MKTGRRSGVADRHDVAQHAADPEQATIAAELEAASSCSWRGPGRAPELEGSMNTRARLSRPAPSVSHCASASRSSRGAAREVTARAPRRRRRDRGRRRLGPDCIRARQQRADHERRRVDGDRLAGAGRDDEHAGQRRAGHARGAARQRSSRWPPGGGAWSTVLDQPDQRPGMKSRPRRRRRRRRAPRASTFAGPRSSSTAGAVARPRGRCGGDHDLAPADAVGHTPPASAKQRERIPGREDDPRSLAEPSPRTANAMATGATRSPTTDSAWPQKRSLKVRCSRSEAGSLRWTAPDAMAAGG